MLSDYLFKSIRCLYTIHALLLICVWPAPVKRQTDDPSWTYCGLVTAAAIQLGLHEPQDEMKPDGGRYSEEEMKLRRNTLLGCFVVSTR
jgi:hypothetical protein